MKYVFLVVRIFFLESILKVDRFLFDFGFKCFRWFLYLEGCLICVDCISDRWERFFLVGFWVFLGWRLCFIVILEVLGFLV